MENNAIDIIDKEKIMSENVVTSSELTIIILLKDRNSTKVVFQILRFQNS